MIHLRWNSTSNRFMNKIWEVGRIFDSDILFIKSSYCTLCYFASRYFSLGLKPLLLTQLRMYQMYLSSQSSVLVVILNQAIHQRALHLYQQLILENAISILSIITIKAFSFVISFISLWTVLLLFTLYWI